MALRWTVDGGRWTVLYATHVRRQPSTVNQDAKGPEGMAMPHPTTSFI
ncbi:MAG: hypothetical protein AAGG75_08310 [Bacteroidota bacterium]